MQKIEQISSALLAHKLTYSLSFII